MAFVARSWVERRSNFNLPERATGGYKWTWDERRRPSEDRAGRGSRAILNRSSCRVSKDDFSRSPRILPNSWRHANRHSFHIAAEKACWGGGGFEQTYATRGRELVGGASKRLFDRSNVH